MNYLTHVMKHWRLRQDHDDSLRIQGCCEVIRLLTTVDKFSKYANKYHVISGLIKILMLGEDGNHNDKIQSTVFVEILKTFISICIGEENCIKRDTYF